MWFQMLLCNKNVNSRLGRSITLEQILKQSLAYVYILHINTSLLLLNTTLLESVLA